MIKWRKSLIFVSLALLLLVSSCGSKPPSKYNQANTESKKGQKPAVVKESEKGGSFNKFFPKKADGYDVNYTQEKTGFAEAKLKKAGKEVATLSINDTTNIPDAAKKFEKSTRKIGGYPAVDVGSTQTSVLVKKRYQVKVISKAPTFTKSDRETWLQKFNLSGLESLK
jgi:hypothetical protein